MWYVDTKQCIILILKKKKLSNLFTFNFLNILVSILILLFVQLSTYIAIQYNKTSLLKIFSLGKFTSKYDSLFFLSTSKYDFYFGRNWYGILNQLCSSLSVFILFLFLSSYITKRIPFVIGVLIYQLLQSLISMWFIL